MVGSKQEGWSMKVDEIWRFQLVRGFTNDISRGACLLTAVSWLVHGRHSDQPPGVCRLLARCGREVNDILANEDRQRLKIFICRLAGSKDNEAMERRARLFVDVVMRGILEAEGLPFESRLSARLTWASARFSILLGGWGSAAGKVIHAFRRRYRKAEGRRKVYFVDLICRAFDEALRAGNQGKIDPVHAASSMNAYEKIMMISKRDSPFATTRVFSKENVALSKG
jgi:hypothetical protein